MLQLGWKAGTEQYGPSELLEYALAAEEAGFDSIAASDHFHPWSEKGQASFVWTWLGAVAARTKSIVLGTSVTCPILRYHPSIIAPAAATAACMAPKRFFLFGHGHRRGAERIRRRRSVARLQHPARA